MKHTAKLREWLFPVIILLFILQVVLLPLMLGLTYATRSERPEHILTYTNGALTWDKETAVRPDGAASLSFFESLYQNVTADNAEKVLAPGTEKDSIVRLKNDTKRTVRYTAILYAAATTADLDVRASLSGDGFSDASDYALPAQIQADTVIRAVNGSLAGDRIQDFDINWFWAFEDETDTADRDRIDTYLGNKAADGAADDAVLGFYLVVHDGGDITPAPSTGERTALRGYIILLCISGGLSLFLALTGRRRRHEP